MPEDAFHGSAHQFDKFSLAHVGAGEGNQSFGWGLYFTDAEAVARYYRDSTIDLHHKPYTVFKFADGTETNRYEDVIKKVVGVDHMLNPDGDSLWAEMDDLFKPYAEHGDDPDLDQTIWKANETLKGWKAQARSGEDREEAAEHIRFWTALLTILRAIKGRKIAISRVDDRADKGAVYHVTLPDDGYLFWDKPMREQPLKVRKALKALAPRYGNHITDCLKDNDRGETLYRHMSNYNRNVSGELGKGDYAGAEKKASLDLASVGIVGIKYLDQFSRDQGHGTYNYVVFDDGHVTIKGRK